LSIEVRRNQRASGWLVQGQAGAIVQGVRFADGRPDMSKYQPLSDHLGSRPDAAWFATFAEVERILGFPLPKAARALPSWWANDPGKAHGRAWSQPGWEVGDLDLAAEQVLFRRRPAPPAGSEAQPVVAERAGRFPWGWLLTGVVVAMGVAALARRR
jgi:hypothetical protein